MTDDLDVALDHATECRRALGRETKRLRVDPVSDPKHPCVKLFEQAGLLEKAIRDYLWEDPNAS